MLSLILANSCAIQWTSSSSSGHNPPSQLESKARGCHSNMCSAYGCNCHNSAVMCIKIVGDPLIVQTCMWPAAKLPVATKPSWGTQLTSYTWQRALFPLYSKHNRGKIWFICLRIQLEQELATCTTLLLTVKLHHHPSASKLPLVFWFIFVSFLVVHWLNNLPCTCTQSGCTPRLYSGEITLRQLLSWYHCASWEAYS